jgi:formylglycine-generating enzyme required for sulfatase activity
VHVERLNGFAIERHSVTNAQFANFVADTPYVTVSERALDPSIRASPRTTCNLAGRCLSGRRGAGRVDHDLCVGKKYDRAGG